MIKFYNEQHEKFYKERMKDITNDCYHQALVYLLGLTEETRSNFNTLVKYEGEHRPCSLSIRPYNYNAEWQTGTTYKITRLAFNLFNGFCYDIEDEEREVSRYYTPYELFCCSFSPYFYEAIKLRYPEYN